jgi:micrococcal nuclease
MAKKPASFEYNGTLVKVLDGDTIDCYIDLGFDLKIKKRIIYMGIDTWESRTRDKEEKVKGLAAKARNKELLEAGTFKIISYGTGKFGRVLGEVFVSPEAVGHEISENIDRSSDGLVSINDILIEEGHAYDYHGGTKKDFKAEAKKEIEAEKAGKKADTVDKPAEEAFEEGK